MPGLKKRLATAFIFATLLILGGFSPAAGQSDACSVTEDTGCDTQYTAYYFHTSKRCAACQRLESWSESAIKSHFQEELGSGELQWKTVNVEKEGNRHFVQDFKLYAQSLVITEQGDGETERWKNLEKVWQLLRDKEAYEDYVTGEIKAFMEKS